MSDSIISVENISKRYVIGHQRGKGDGLRHVIESAVRSPLRWLQQRKQAIASEHEEFWALKEVSFEVKQGDVVGIIGRNGAGKSTLLKILSRITEPTSGRIRLRGRVASLLEVGTGFHPELTGRENIFLNGAILGMSKVEIKRKFDEIVAFSEIEKFLDTPVKRYSSGMYVRLAFAVAAHLEPEILIIDEVLAVGDAEFQRKCMGKMKDVATGGRTILFVSHNMAAISNLCSRAIAMKNGKIFSAGTVTSCVESYLTGSQMSGLVWERSVPPASNSPVFFTKVSLKLEGNQPLITLHLDCEIETKQGHKPAFVAVDILDGAGTGVMQAIPTLEGVIKSDSSISRFRISIQLPPLVPGNYSATVWMGPHNTETYDEVVSAVSFEIFETPTKGRKFPHTRDHGCIVPMSSLHF